MGAPLLVVVCEQRTDGVLESQTPCVSTNENHFVLVTREIYALDVAQGAAILGVLEPVDAASASQAFGIAMSAVVFCWLIGRSVGMILESIKKL